MWIQAVAIALPRIQRHYEGELGFRHKLGCVPGGAVRIDHHAGRRANWCPQYRCMVYITDRLSILRHFC